MFLRTAYRRILAATLAEWSKAAATALCIAWLVSEFERWVRLP